MRRSPGTQAQGEGLLTRVDLTRWIGLIELTVAVGVAYFLAARLSLASARQA